MNKDWFEEYLQSLSTIADTRELRAKRRQTEAISARGLRLPGTDGEVRAVADERPLLRSDLTEQDVVLLAALGIGGGA